MPRMARFSLRRPFHRTLICVPQHERMPLTSLLLLTSVTSGGLGAAALLQWRRRRRAEALAAQAAEALAARTRQLDLFAQELHGLGLTMMGQSALQPAAPVEHHARALLCLAADVHDAAAATAGPRRLREEALPLAPVVQDAIEQVSVALTPGRREWRVEAPLREATLLADRRALRGALVQVLTRAVRHSRDGDPIVLGLVQADDTVAIVVEDEGAGLGGGDLRGGGAPDGTRGLGLGLVVARQLLRAHEGELTVEAVRGVGARTWLTLPRARLLTPATLPHP